MRRLGQLGFWMVVLALSAVSCGGSETSSLASAAHDATGSADPTAIRPFQVDIPEPVLADLRDRLRRTRYPGEIAGSDWQYGTNLAYLKELVGYWTDEFDWRAQERQINGFDHFKTVIDGLDIHFIHQRSPVEDATPLLISHGWPGSFLEFMKVIGPLTDPVAHGGSAQDPFHVVVPSIPGYGFSEKPREHVGGTPLAHTASELDALGE